MFASIVRSSFLSLSCALLACSLLRGGDCPQLGCTDDRNSVSDEKGLPESFDPGPKLPGGEFDLGKGQNVKWVQRLGSYCCSNPTIAGGKIFIGTNGVVPRDPKYKATEGHKEGYGVMLCFEESTGKFLWQCCLPAIRSQGYANMFFAQLGVCSTPLVDANRLYFVSNRAEVVCLTTDGLAGGKNEGPFTDEAILYSPFEHMKLNPEEAVNGKIMAAKKGLPIWVWDKGQPVTLGPTDADVVWRYDMLNDLPCWVQDAASCSALMHDDLLYVCAPNGVDQSHRNVPTPDCPGILVMDKKTGKILATDELQIGKRILHGSWSSLSLGKVNGRSLLFFAGPDGCCYALDPKPVPSTSNNGLMVIKKVWSFDGNLPQNRFTDPRKANYARHDHPQAEGPSEYIATPVLHNGRVYIANGQDPRHGFGSSVLSCIDASKEGDVTDSAKVWQFTDMNRTLSTVSIRDGLLFIGDLKGAINCIDIATGKRVWVHETGSPMWGSTLVADGKVYFGNEKGDFYVLAASRELKVLSKINLGAPIYATPSAANGVLYVATNKHLFAIQARK